MHWKSGQNPMTQNIIEKNVVLLFCWMDMVPKCLLNIYLYTQKLVLIKAFPRKASVCSEMQWTEKLLTGHTTEKWWWSAHPFQSSGNITEGGVDRMLEPGHEMGALKYCLSDMTCLLHSSIHSSCGYLHKTRHIINSSMGGKGSPWDVMSLRSY